MFKENDMTRDEFLTKYWRYYYSLESKFINTIEYVELTEINFHTYSNGFAHLLLTIGAELDDFFKEYCHFRLDDRRKKISDYAAYIDGKYPTIRDQKIILKEYNIIISPFENWNVNCAAESLVWWTAFNEIKHGRAANIEKATLENVVNILGALYLLEMKYLKEITEETNDIDIPNEGSRLFELEGWNYNYGNWGNWPVRIENGKPVLDGGSALE